MRPSQAGKKELSPWSPPTAARAPRSSLSPLIKSSSRYLCPTRLVCRVPACARGSCRKLFRRTPDAAHRQQSLRLVPGDETLASEYGIELIVPDRRGRKRLDPGWTQQLSRYRRRWKAERLFAWMHNFRRLVTRWEYYIENFLGFVDLACLHMLPMNF
jgi:hypothetical protein